MHLGNLHILVEIFVSQYLLYKCNNSSVVLKIKDGYTLFFECLDQVEVKEFENLACTGNLNGPKAEPGLYLARSQDI